MPWRAVDVDGGDAAANPSDHREGGLSGGVRLAVDSPGRDMHEVAGASIDVALVALELEAEYAAHDVQTRLVALVVVPSRDRPRISLDLAGPEERQVEGQRAGHAGRWVGGSEVGRREDPYRPRQFTAHAFRVSRPRATAEMSRTSSTPPALPSAGIPVPASLRRLSALTKATGLADVRIPHDLPGAAQVLAPAVFSMTPRPYADSALGNRVSKSMMATQVGVTETRAIGCPCS